MDEKFVSNLNGYVVKDATARKQLQEYTTPQMFGAKADGVTDDTQAFNDAIASGLTLRLPAGKYRIDGTINLVNGVRIEGNKNSVIEAYGETVFHLARHNTLTGFYVKVKSDAVLTVFEIDDASCASAQGEASALLYDRIIDVDVHHEYPTIPEMYTVCHFHTDTQGMYDVIVRDCNFRNGYTTGGYCARVYATQGNGGWFNGAYFENCNTSNFVWHYFFANNDAELVNGICSGNMISGCVAQCTKTTNGFVFIPTVDTVSLRTCKPWDWGSSGTGSTNCPGRPYVLKKDIAIKNGNRYSELGSSERIIFYDGTEFSVDNAHKKQGLLVNMGAGIMPALTPKYVALTNQVKCVKLATINNPHNEARVRFYLVDGCGITYISIYPASKIVEVDRPLTYGYKIGGTSDGAIYLYLDNGYGIGSGTGILNLPIANNYCMFAQTGSSNNTLEYTVNIWGNPDNYVLDAVPDGVEEYTIRRSMPAYIPGDDGKIYNLKVVTGEDGTKSLSFIAVSTIKKERD